MTVIANRQGFWRGLTVSLAAALILSACSMEHDTFMSHNRLKLEHGPSYSTYKAADLHDDKLRALADDYRRYGNGPLELAVTYDPRSNFNTAMHATEEAARIARELRYLDIDNIETAILPVNGQGDHPQALIRYDAVTAHAPDDCFVMGGADGGPTYVDENYRQGCTIETLLARQIARPRDLAGRAGMDAADGRRQTETTEGYRAGETASPLSGYAVE